MRQFFKFFFAALLALVVFCVLGFFVLMGAISALGSAAEVTVDSHTVLFMDLSGAIPEQGQEDPFGGLLSDESAKPGVFDIVRLIQHAKTNDQVDGIYLKCGGNANGFGTNEELRLALADFKKSGKFIIAYGEVVPQQAYYVASVADKLYVHPKGGLDWKGMGLQYVFFKKALDRLQIQPQIFYAGKFKSATEPFREEHMTDPNRLQSTVLLEDLYQHFLSVVGQSRQQDTAQLRAYANNGSIRSAEDAVRAGLADGLRYEDEVKEEIRSKSSGKSIESIAFMSMAKYASAVSYKGSGTDRIALIYAAGDIVDGSGDYSQVGGDRFRRYIRKARLDKDTKAIVIRINSGGGSAMASENMWREIALAKKDKPVVVSYGDVAASGGYYMACNADSIFALPNTITGSIGVFSIIPNLQGFMDNKLGVTFDGVETGPFANSPTIAEPLSDMEKKFIQSDVDSIYHTFLSRVADGRKMTIAAVDSIGQGRVWTGNRALKIGLIDRIGSLNDALAAAARLGKTSSYRVREFPEQMNVMEKWKNSYKNNAETAALKNGLAQELLLWYREVEQLQSSFGKAQTKMPFRLKVY